MAPHLHLQRAASSKLTLKDSLALGNRFVLFFVAKLPRNMLKMKQKITVARLRAKKRISQHKRVRACKKKQKKPNSNKPNLYQRNTTSQAMTSFA